MEQINAEKRTLIVSTLREALVKSNRRTNIDEQVDPSGRTTNWKNVSEMSNIEHENKPDYENFGGLQRMMKYFAEKKIFDISREDLSVEQKENIGI